MGDTIEVKVLQLTRVPPGDRWKTIHSDTIHASLTDALNAVFSQTGLTTFYFDARVGKVFSVSEETRAPEPPQPEKKYSIYGDE